MAPDADHANHADNRPLKTDNGGMWSIYLAILLSSAVASTARCSRVPAASQGDPAWMERGRRSSSGQLHQADVMRASASQVKGCNWGRRDYSRHLRIRIVVAAVAPFTFRGCAVRWVFRHLSVPACDGTGTACLQLMRPCNHQKLASIIHILQATGASRRCCIWFIPPSPRPGIVARFRRATHRSPLSEWPGGYNIRGRLVAHQDVSPLNNGRQEG